MKRYRVTYERDEDGYWTAVAKVTPLRSAISDGQTLPKARRRIRQSLALLLDVPEDSFEIVDHVKLPAPASRALKQYRHLSEARLQGPLD
jgi:predicted RNase H-like HicB family nuclease